MTSKKWMDMQEWTDMQEVDGQQELDGQQEVNITSSQTADISNGMSRFPSLSSVIKYDDLYFQKPSDVCH